MDLELRLEKKGIPYYVQLRDQIIQAICTGRLRAGDRLPSVRGLAEQHGIATNTALRALHELERDGWVTIKSGSQYTVREPTDSEAPVSNRTVEVIGRFHDTLSQVRASGISAEAFAAVSGQLIAETWAGQQPEGDFIVFISEDESGKDLDVTETESLLGLPVRWVHLQDVRSFGAWALGDVRRARLILTMFYRYREVSQRLGPLPVHVHPVTPANDPRVIPEAANFNRPNVRVAVVAHDQAFMAALSLFAKECLYLAEIVGYATIDDPAAVEHLVQHADVVAANFWAKDERYRHLLHGKPALVLGNRAHPTVYHLLREILDARLDPSLAPSLGLAAISSSQTG